jgi:hypothetical protein
VVGCALTGKLVRLLLLGTGCYFEPDRNRRACQKLMHFMVGRVVAKLMHSLAAAVGNKVGKEAEELCASGQCAAAAVALKLVVTGAHKQQVTCRLQSLRRDCSAMKSINLHTRALQNKCLRPPRQRR